MKTKSETQLHLYSFHALVKTQFNANIKIVRSDNGTEFLVKDLHNFFLDKGIIHQRSCIGTLQQNGMVERKHRHLLEVARGLRFQANLPIKFWGECVLTAAYLLNKLPGDALNGKTPHEMLFGIAPDLSRLKVFGCLCFAKNLQIKNKFD